MRKGGRGGKRDEMAARRVEGRERERETGRVEGRRACKGYEKRILSSLFGMQDERPDLYAPRVPSSRKGKRKRERMRILACGLFDVSRAESIITFPRR